MTPYTVCYHQDGILVVNKPIGIPSQPSPNYKTDLYTALRQKFSYVGMHHRLDTPTSGLLLLTTDKNHNSAIAEQLRNRDIKRTYWAAMLSHPPEAGVWTKPVNGKEAITHYTIIHRGRDISVAQVRLETGRMHQIRRHAEGAGHPILGDRRYGGSCGRLWPRLALHAQSLQFFHPSLGETINVTTRLPEELEGLYSM
ncbi:MAG: RluA family pseudouridine synthase [Myxococcota bacterium]